VTWRALALAVMFNGCAPEAPPTIRLDASVVPPAPAPVAVGVEWLPLITHNECPVAERPAHRLTISADGVALDDTQLATFDPTIVARALTRRELTLDVHLLLDYGAVRPVLARLSEIAGLRLWISVHVGGRQVRHLPIDLPRYGAPRPKILPPHDYTRHIVDELGPDDRSDPLALPEFDEVSIELDNLFVSAVDRVSWQAVTEALADTCGGSVLVDPPTCEALPRISLTATDATVTDGLDADQVDRETYPDNRLHLCFRRARHRGLLVRGRVGLSFTVDGRGRVTGAVLDPPTPRDPELEQCVDVATQWPLTAPADGRDAVVHRILHVYPFDVAAGERGYPTVHLDDPKVRGPLNDDVVESVIRPRLLAVRECYDQALDPAAAGRVKIAFTIRGNGKVDQVAVQAAAPGLGDAAACIAEVVRSTKFPPPGRSAQVVAPFDLERGERQPKRPGAPVRLADE